MTGYAIDITGAAKTYRGKVRALRGVDMRVHRGEVFGLLGPNGAGKSTLVKILMTVIRPTKCRGTMLGRPVGEKKTLARVGYLPEHHRFPGYLKGWQVLDFYGAMAGVPRRERKKRIGELLELVGMGEWRNKRIKQYSKGMRQRVGLAQALMNDPELVLLDEPTDGVDPVGRRDIRGICQRLKEEGRTVFINSHLLSELEMVCDRVAILVQGEVARQGTIDELTAGQRYYAVELASAETAAALAGAVGEGFDRGVRVEGATLVLPTTEPARVQPVIDEARRRGGTIVSVRLGKPSLEDLFMQAVTDPNTGDVLRPGAAGAGKGGKADRGGKRGRR
ncbi:MAG TPA: ABC transporter ATP-binding protein [Phycisphaerales bacterium]|nr:ABC transporter ATP-binding protein [Phycisphaerales bacterium]